jgi:hypothetical protein
MPVVMVAGLPVTQARDPGLQPFCVTVDQQAGEYLPQLFGSGGYVVIHCPSQLPRAVAIRPFDRLMIAIKNVWSSGCRSSRSELTQIN